MMNTIFEAIYSFFTESVTEHHNHLDVEPIEPTYLHSLYWVSIKWLFMSVLVFLIIVMLHQKVKWFKRMCEWILNNCLVVLILAVWAMGFITYTVGAHIPNENQFFDVAPMAMIHSTEMFLSISDISAIHPDCSHSARFMTLFNLSHFFAIILSLVFIIKKFGHNLIARAKLWMESWIEFFFGKREKDVYVFWGLNDASFNLAKDTIKNLQGKEKAYYIVFVRTPESNDEEDSKMGISRIFNMSNMKNREIERLKELEKEGNGAKIYSTSSYQRLSLLQVPENKVTEDIIEEKLRLKSLARLLVRFKGKNKINIFFLGNDMDANIQATINMLKDKLVQTVEAKIYCRARKSAKTHWMESYNYCHITERTSVSIIDTSELSVSELKQNVDSHPVQLVDFDPKTAAAISSFNCLIIGLGGTGQEALKFLYEFGAFVNPQGKKSEFHCTIIDEQMDNYIGTFNALAPALANSEEIELCSFVMNSKEYWEKIQNIIDNLDYVVVALGNDDITLETIATLCKMAIRWRSSNKKKLQIHVRSYAEGDCDQLSTMCEDITSKYNKSKQEEYAPTSAQVNKDEDLNIFVSTFGSMKNIFTYDKIISEKILDEAREYNLEYKRTEFFEKDKKSSTSSKSNEFENDKVQQWKRALGIKDSIKENDKDEKNPIYSIVELDTIERKRIQNFSNSMHAATKIHILKDICQQNIYEKIDNVIFDNLARIEHERWVAQMKLIGWQKTPLGEVKDDYKKYRDDICSSDDVNEFDKMVVNTSISLYKKNNTKCNNEKK